MRKPWPNPILACLLAVPVVLAATGQPALADYHPLISSPLSGDPLDAAEARGRLQAAQRSAVRNAKAEADDSDAPPHLEAIAACESGGDPRAIGGGGAYRGKYQFSPTTWAAVGGSGDPAAAPEGEQDQRAADLYARSGPSQWPVCGS